MLALNQHWQGRWFTWKAVTNRVITWADIQKMPQAKSFLIRVTFHTLPSPWTGLHLSDPDTHPRCLKGSTEAGLNTDGDLARSSANKPKYWSHTGQKQKLLAQIRDSSSSSSTAMSLKREDTPIIGRLLVVTADLGTTTITTTPLRPDIVFKSSFCLGTVPQMPFLLSHLFIAK